MPSEPLETVLLLRRRAVDAARLRLAAATETASEAGTAARALEGRIEAETDRASDPAGTDDLVEAFAAWLPGARHAALQARTVHEQKEAEVSRCRAELASCRTALETIQTLISERDAARAAAVTRKEQNEMDEAAARRRSRDA